MTTWGTKPFENDVAIDLFERVESLDEDRIVASLRDTLRAVVDRPGVVEVHEAHTAIAAATLIAACASNEPTGSARVDAWLARHRLMIRPDDQRLALRALERIRGPESEWPELWSTTGRGGAINARVDALKASLSAGAGAEELL
jgi:hypothetical protein